MRLSHDPEAPWDTHVMLDTGQCVEALSTVSKRVLVIPDGYSPGLWRTNIVPTTVCQALSWVWEAKRGTSSGDMQGGSKKVVLPEEAIPGLVLETRAGSSRNRCSGTRFSGTKA